MDFELSERQAVVQAAAQRILEPFRAVTHSAPNYFKRSPALEQQLDESGFFDVNFDEDYTALDAALLVYETARVPVVVEVAASTLVAPHMGAGALARPIALADRRSGAIRYLPNSRTLLLLENGEAHVASLEGVRIDPLGGVLAYPFGRLGDPTALEARSLGPGSGESLARWWRIALAVEAAGQLRGALDATIDYVSQRTQFGRRIG